jgi:hypothetical protein
VTAAWHDPFDLISRWAPRACVFDEPVDNDAVRAVRFIQPVS